jgi:hypothetical protein|nr:MAG TPA: hypothetical protein [Caudoviricetes sp.]
MYFKTDKYEGNMVEDSFGLRWAETEQGKIPAYIMFEYMQGVIPESMLNRVFNQSNVMFNDLERRLRREANRYNYTLGDIKSNKETNHIEVYKNMLDMVGRDPDDYKRIRTYSVGNLTCHKAVGLTEGAKSVVINTKSHKNDWLWIEGEMTIYENFEIVERQNEVRLADFLYKYFYHITDRNWHTMKVLF